MIDLNKFPSRSDDNSVIDIFSSAEEICPSQTCTPRPAPERDAKFPVMEGDCTPEFPENGQCFGGGGIGGSVKLHKIYCDTVADFPQGVDVDEGMLIQTAGYYAKYDGGGANYVCRFVHSQSAMPWAIDLGESKEIQEQLVYGDDGEPVVDENGEYVIVTDNNGNPVYAVDENGEPIQKHLYACIDEKVVNYRMFGAKLDGVVDDETALLLTHAYQKSVYEIEPESGRKRYTVSVENHEGIIKKSSNNPIICAGNIDLSGSKLVLQDSNATWFGFYLWGDNEEDFMTYEPTEATKDTYRMDNFVIGTKGNESTLKQNSLLFLRETPYAVRDDGGYLYSEPRYELILHTSDGVLANPFTEDWHNAGGGEISAPFSDYQTHEVSTDTLITALEVSYTRIPSAHYYFKGCEVIIDTAANLYQAVLWCKCHNAHISGFTFYPDTTKMHNTVFKNTMIYLWGCYNVAVSDIVGFNAAGKMESGANATSGYVIRATNCLNVKLHDISVQGYWGATAMNCVKDVHIERVSINRLDIHNYFYNLFIDQCNLYNHAVQIGEGRGICQITNTNFYINELTDDSYPHAHMVEFNTTYGRIFEGKVLVENCNAFIKGAAGNEFDVFKMDFSPEAVSKLPHYKFPEVTVRNCHFFSYDADTYLVYFMVAGSRNCKTSGKSPTNIKDYCRDTGNDNTGSLFWKYIGRGVDWFDNGDSTRLNVVPGQFVRTYETYKNSEGKTVFYNHKLFVVTAAGTLPTPTSSNKPSDTSGNTFTCGTATLQYVENHVWDSNKDYAVGDYCYTETSSWLPVWCFECVTAGHSNGYKPVHSSGTVIDGEDVYPKNLDACYWQYTSTLSSFISATFSPNMNVTANQVIYADHKLYRVTESGKLRSTPPVNTPWTGTFKEGTATLEFLGKDWSPKTWWAKDHYCVSNVNGTPKVYKAVTQNGITSGNVPVPGNARCVDGDMIWEYTTETATKQWSAYSQFYVGDVVSANGNNYRCVFDGRLEMPHQIVLEDISTNMTMGGDIFAFWTGGTDIPTKHNSKGEWRIRISDVEFFRFRDFSSYFLHEGNPDPVIDYGGGGGKAFSKVKTGTTTIEASQAEDKLELEAGRLIELAGNTTTKKVTIASSLPLSVKNGLLCCIFGAGSSQSQNPDPDPSPSTDPDPQSDTFDITALRTGETLTVPDTVITLDNSGNSDWNSTVQSSALNSAIGVGNTVKIEYVVFVPTGNGCTWGPEFIIYTNGSTETRFSVSAGGMTETTVDGGKLYTAVVQYTINASASNFPFYKQYGANSGGGAIKARLRVSNLTQAMTADVVSQNLYPWD